MSVAISVTIELEDVVKELEHEVTLTNVFDEWPNKAEKQTLIADIKENMDIQEVYDILRSCYETDSEFITNVLDDMDISDVMNVLLSTHDTDTILNAVGKREVASWIMGNE